MQSTDPTTTLIAELVSRLGWTLAIEIALLAALVLAAASMGKTVVNTWLERRAGIAFDKQLADHRSALDAELETRRAAYAKELATHTGALSRQLEEVRHFYRQEQQRLELYAGSQHRVYPEVYRLFRIAEGLLVRQGIDFVPDYRKCSRAEIDRAAKRVGVPDETRLEILETFNTDRAAAGARLGSAMESARDAKVLRAFQRAKNYLAINELFLSPTSGAAASRVVSRMAAYAAWILCPEEGKSLEQYKSGASVGLVLQELRDVLAKELAAVRLTTDDQALGEARPTPDSAA